MKKRPNPDELLASLQKEEAKQKKGKLKIFLGMCPGVGKTYAMLQDARQRAKEGLDVLIGVVETHSRKETEALLEGVPAASKMERSYKGTHLLEMDIDTILMIRPQLVVVDELAHTNAPGSRHPKRYQDVLELLDAGINVYTTLNVQHIESRAETVKQITGANVQETVPDSILDEADEITLIDLPPEQLRERLKEGKVYLGERAAAAADNFFRAENLIALREMALRITAERVNQDLREIMSEQQIEGPWKSGERLMVAVGPTPFSESLIRWTRRTASALNAPWIAVYVETTQNLNEDEKKRLTRNLSLARQLGAEVIIKTGTDVASTLIETARQNNVSQICVGKPFGNIVQQWLQGGSFIGRLIRQSGDIDIHMVRVKSFAREKPKLKPVVYSFGSGQEYGIVLFIIVAVTFFSFLVDKIAGYSAVSLIYLLSVFLSGVILSRWPVLALSGLSAFLWNYLFIPPRFTFYIYKSYDLIMFTMYFVVAMVMGHITTRLREREKAEKKQEERANVLYRLTRTIAITHDSKEALQNALSQLEEILKVKSSLFLVDDKEKPIFEKPYVGELSLTGKEKSVANYTFQKKQPAGRFTETLPESENFYSPLVSMNKTVGVLAIRPIQSEIWSLDQRTLVESFSSLLTVILEKDIFSRMTAETKVKIESEKLQAALLDGVSHELKTPLTVIAGSAEHLENSNLNPEMSKGIIKEIREASGRLLQTVNSLLDMTRLDSGHIQLNLDWHDMRDVVSQIAENFKDNLKTHRLKVTYADQLPLVKIDAVIVQQIITNLLSNAIAYSPLNTQITISVHIDEKRLVVNVIDEGPGIPEEDLDRIFEKFYKGKRTKTGGLGLGLSIAKRFVEAHKGEIEIRNLDGKGACFTFHLPVEIFNQMKESSND